MTKLSYTAMQKYLECPYSYRLYYKDRLRPKLTGSALIFGSAVDAGVTHLLRTRDLREAKEVFDATFSTFVDVERRTQRTIESRSVVYLPGDEDRDLLSEEDLRLVEEGKAPVQYLCLVRKGHLMLEAFNSWALPSVKRVLALQDEVTLVNAHGDEVPGKLDAVVELKDGRIVLMDLKTSGRPYANTSVRTSPQLATYLPTARERYGATHAGYWVLLKTISKNKKKICSKCGYDGSGKTHLTCPEGNPRCKGSWNVSVNPRAYVQILVDEVPDRQVEVTQENFDEVVKGVKNEVFYKNFSSCDRPWGPCPYKKLCHEGSSDELVVAPRRTDV